MEQSYWTSPSSSQSVNRSIGRPFSVLRMRPFVSSCTCSGKFEAGKLWHGGVIVKDHQSEP
jgi:hypothetical protein